MTRKILFTIFAVFSAVLVPGLRGYPVCIEDKDLEKVVKSLEVTVSAQERSIISLRAKYEGLQKQRKQLAESIEENKKKLQQKQLQEAEAQKLREAPKHGSPVELKKQQEEELREAERRAKSAWEEARKKQEEADRLAKRNKESREQEKKKQAQARLLAEEKERLAQAERQKQILQAFDRTKDLPEPRDVNYLDKLIKRQRELCSVITQLQANVSVEERNLKQLKESRKKSSGKE